MYKFLDLIKAILLLVFILFLLLFPLVLGLVTTNIVIWLANGLFNCDLHAKFWYIYVLVVIIVPLVFGKFSLTIRR